MQETARFEHYKEREAETRELASEGVEIEELDEDPSRICWRNLCQDNVKCRLLCGFNVEEFLHLYELVDEHLFVNDGKGRRSKISKQDQLFISLCHLKHYETLDEMKLTFGISKTHLCRVLGAALPVVSRQLYNHFVINRIEEAEEEEEEIPFPNAKYILFTVFQAINVPVGNNKARRPYFDEQYRTCELQRYAQFIIAKMLEICIEKIVHSAATRRPRALNRSLFTIAVGRWCSVSLARRVLIAILRLPETTLKRLRVFWRWRWRRRRMMNGTFSLIKAIGA